MSHNLF